MAYAYQPQQAWQSYPAQRTTAPVSLHVVAVFQYLGGLITLAIGAIMALAAFKLFPKLEYSVGADTWTNRPADITLATGVVCGVVILGGLTAILLGRKVQRGRNWARVVLTVLNVLSIAGTAWQGYTTGGMYASTLAAIAFPLLFVILLNTRAARSWCRHHTY